MVVHKGVHMVEHYCPMRAKAWSPWALCSCAACAPLLIIICVLGTQYTWSAIKQACTSTGHCQVHRHAINKKVGRPASKHEQLQCLCALLWLVQPDAVVICDLLLCVILAGSHKHGTAAGLSWLWLIRDARGNLPSIKFFLKTGAVPYELLKQGDQ